MLIEITYGARRVMFVRAAGQTKTISQWAADLAITRDALAQRVRRGPINESAFFRPLTRHERHGLCRTPTWVAWKNMKYRCLNPRAQFFADYGGRGIKVCDRWRHFSEFLADMGECPKGLTLDRIDNEGHYEPGNCRWASIAEQVANRRCSVHLAFNGVTMLASEWARARGMRLNTLLGRLRRGLSAEEALTRPIGRWESIQRPITGEALSPRSSR